MVVVRNPVSGLDRFVVALGKEQKPCQVAVGQGQKGIQGVGAMKLLKPFVGSAGHKKKIFPVAGVRASVEELPVFQYPADASPLSPIYPASLLQELQDLASKRAKEAVETARKILVAAGLKPLEVEAAPVGNARVFILEVAKEWAADLIVVGSHGRRGLNRLIMGSVSESVAIYAHCSVEVVRK